MEQQELSFIRGGNVNWEMPFGKLLLSTIVKHLPSLLSNNSTCRYIPRLKECMCKHVQKCSFFFFYFFYFFLFFIYLFIFLFVVDFVIH